MYKDEQGVSVCPFPILIVSYTTRMLLGMFLCPNIVFRGLKCEAVIFSVMAHLECMLAMSINYSMPELLRDMCHVHVHACMHVANS